MIQERVIAEYRAEQDRAKQPGYVSRYDDYYEYEAEKAPTKMPERTHVEPAEMEPRPPHRAPSQQRAARESSADRTRNDDFGAGIF